MIRHLFNETLAEQLPAEFPRMTYHEAISRFGTDRPDLRIPLELVDIADEMKDVDFKVFSGPANDPDGRVVGVHSCGFGDHDGGEGVCSDRARGGLGARADAPAPGINRLLPYPAAPGPWQVIGTNHAN